MPKLLLPQSQIYASFSQLCCSLGNIGCILNIWLSRVLTAHLEDLKTST